MFTDVSAEIDAWCAADGEAVRVTRASYAPEHLTQATLVIAATDNPELNASIADEARAAGKLVNVADAPELGDFVTPAVHRSGDVVIAVATGGVPRAAARIRDSIAASFGDRYGIAIDSLSRLRRALLDRGERDAWRAASSELIGAAFCDEVESGKLTVYPCNYENYLYAKLKRQEADSPFAVLTRGVKPKADDSAGTGRKASSMN